MCVAAPARIVTVGTATAASRPATVVSGGRRYGVDLVMTPEAGVGDHVIVHSGYAVSTVSSEEAARIERLMSGVDRR